MVVDLRRELDRQAAAKGIGGRRTVTLILVTGKTATFQAWLLLAATTMPPWPLLGFGPGSPPAAWLLLLLLPLKLEPGAWELGLNRMLQAADRAPAKRRRDDGGADGEGRIWLFVQG